MLKYYFRSVFPALFDTKRSSPYSLRSSDGYIIFTAEAPESDSASAIGAKRQVGFPLPVDQVVESGIGRFFIQILVGQAAQAVALRFQPGRP